jgi:nucleotide-binding universal stress UspA family protein
MYSQILVPLDGSNAAEGALDHARDLAHDGNATLHLLQVVSHSDALAHGGDGSILATQYTLDLARQLFDVRKSHAEEYLGQVASTFAEGGVGVETAVREGDASQEVVDYAKEHSIDLIVMSTRGHGAIRRFLVGSVTDRVIRSSEIPVLAVPPE